jgi:hypothetical protein
MIRDWQGRIWEYREDIFDWIKISYNKWTFYTSWLQFVDKWYSKEEIITSGKYSTEQAQTFWWWLTRILIGPLLKVAPQYDIAPNSIGEAHLIWEMIFQHDIAMNSIGKPSLIWQISPQYNIATNSIGYSNFIWGVSPQYDVVTNSIGETSLMWGILPQCDVVIGKINEIDLEWQLSPQYDILTSRIPTKWYGYTSWQTLAGTSGKWYGD